MSAYALLFVVTAVSLGQNQSPPDATLDEQIRQAVVQLGDSRFRVRDRASKFLWRQGLASQAALEDVVLSGDREVRLRAKQILEDFHYGILPTTPTDELIAIRKFRDGDAEERKTAFDRLVSNRRYTTVQRLLVLEKQAMMRRLFLRQLFQDKDAVAHYIELGSIQQLIDAVGADQDVNWRNQMLGDLLFAPEFLRQLIRNNRLGVVTSYIKKEKSVEVRRSLLEGLFRNQLALQTLLENSQLAFLLEFIAGQPDAATRGQFLSQLTISTTFSVLVKNGELPTLLEFIQAKADAQMQKTIYTRMFQSSSTVRTLLTTNKLEELIKLITDVNDAEVRGQLLAQLMGNSAVRSRLQNEGKMMLIIETADNLKDEVSQRAYIKQLLRTSIMYSLSEEMMAGLWKSIRNVKDFDWQADTLSGLLGHSRFYQMLEKKEDTAWLLDVVQRSDAEAASAMLNSLLNNSRVHTILIEHGHFDQLLKLVLEAKGETQGAMLGRLVGSSAIANHLKNQKQMERLVALAKQQEDPEIRADVLRGLFKNFTAMQALMEAGQYDVLYELVLAEKNESDRCALVGDFFKGGGVTEYLVKNKKRPLLLSYLDEKFSDDARNEYMQRLFTNTAAMNELLDEGHYEQLFAAAKAIQDDEDREELVGKFLTHARTIVELEKQGQLEILIDHIADLEVTQQRQLTKNIMGNATTLESLVKRGYFKVVLSWIKAERESYRRGSAVGSLISSSNVVRTILKTGDVKLLFDFVRDEQDMTARQRMLYYMVSRTTTTGLLVDAGHFDDIMALLDKHPKGSRGDLLGRFLALPNTLQWLQKQDRLDSVFETVAATTDANVKRTTVARLFGNTTSIEFFIKHGKFDELLDLATREPNSTSRVQLLGSLFATSSAVQQLIKRERVELLLDLAATIDNESSRASYLTRIVRSNVAVDALSKKGMFGELVKTCRATVDDKQRAQMMTTLMSASESLKQLKEGGYLKSFVDELLDNKEKEVRMQFLRAVVYRTETLDYLVKMDYLNQVIKRMKEDLTGSTLRSTLLKLYSAPSVVQQLAKTDGMDQLLQLLADETNATQRRQLVTTLCQNTETLAAILKHSGLDPIVQQINRDPASANRITMLNTLLYSSATIQYLHDQKQLVRLFELIADYPADANLRRRVLQLFYSAPAQDSFGQAGVAEAYVKLLESEDASVRSNYVTQFLQNTVIRRALIRADQLDVLYRVLKLEQNEANRKRFARAVLYSSSGAIPAAIGSQDVERAEQMLRENLKDDMGRLRLVNYLLLQGRLNNEIEQIQAREPQERTENEQRLLVYLLRAHGDLEAAGQAAKLTGDKGLEKALAVERRDWKLAAALQTEDPCLLPIPLANAARYEKYQTIEQTGLRYAYQRLAGMQDAAEESLKQLMKLREEATDKSYQWHVNEILLLNDQFQAGLEGLKRTHERRAFHLYWYRHEYAAALKAVRWNAEDPKAWFDAIAADVDVNSTAQRDKLFFGLQVARLLMIAGRKEESLDLFEVIEAFSETQPTSGQVSKTLCLEYVSRDLLTAGERKRAWEVGIKTVRPTSTYPPNLLSRIYYRRSRPLGGIQSRSWWRFFRNRDASAPAEEIFERVDGMMRMRPETMPENIDELVDASITFGETTTESTQREYWHGLGYTFFLLERYDDARSCLERIEADVPRARDLLVTIARKEEDWERAAELSTEIYLADSARVIHLFLAGDSLEQLGKSEEGREKKTLANLLLVDSRERHDFAVGLQANGFNDLALQQWQMLRKVAPPDHWECHEAARRLALAEEDPAEAAAQWQQYIFGDMRPAFYFNESRSYLSIPLLMHKLRARAAIAAGDFEQAEKEIALALTATKSETTFCEELIPELIQAKRKDLADQLFADVYQHYTARISEHPASAILLNNLAWMSARCGRRLDEALTLVNKAIELRPEVGSYLDTCAEIQFRLGNRQEAIRYGEKAIAASPTQADLREQLERFRNDPLPKPQD